MTNRSRPARAVAVAVAFALGVAACGDDGPSRGEAVVAMAATATTAFEDAAAAAVTLDEAAATACDDGSDGARAQALAAADEARQAWRRTEAYWFGPVSDRRSPARVDWPADIEAVDATLAASEPASIDTEYVGSLVGSDQRGFEVAEHLLGSPLDERACQYLAAVTSVVVDETAAVVDAWTTSFDDGPSYAQVLAADPDMAVDEAVNQQLMLLELIGDRDTDAMLLEEGLLDARLAGAETMFAGEASLGPLLGDELQGRLLGEFEAARTAAAALESDHAGLDTARQLVLDAQRTVSAEVVSRLGVVVGFSDGDGDSGG